MWDNERVLGMSAGRWGGMVCMIGFEGGLGSY